MSSVTYILCERAGTKWVPVLRWRAPSDTCLAVAEEKLARAKNSNFPRLQYYQKVRSAVEFAGQKNYDAEREQFVRDIE